MTFGHDNSNRLSKEDEKETENKNSDNNIPNKPEFQAGFNYAVV